MNPSLHADILSRLSEFNFKQEKEGYLRGGTCPGCQKKELYTHANNPWVVRCGRLNKCGYEGHVKELYPDLFDDWSKRYQTPEATNPQAAADAYMQHGRGFTISRVQGLYKQESYFDKDLNIGSATVRFAVADGYWERLIDKPHRFGKKKARFSFGSHYQGKFWSHPAHSLQAVEEIWIVEGIFDAIALEHHGIAAVSIMSCNNYPLQSLQDLRDARGNQDCRLVWALDGDHAGRSFTHKHIERARAAGWECAAAQIPQNGKLKLDWNDLHQRDKLTEADIENYRYHGSILIAERASDKALLIYGKEGKTEFDFAFRNRLYWFNLDLVAYNKEMDQLDSDGSTSILSEAGKREKALNASHTIRPIANCNPVALYYQKNDMTDEAWYYFRVDFPHDGASIKNTFTSSQISSSAEFKKRLLGIAPGAMFSGTSAMLDRIMERDLFHIKRVETIDFIGYSKEYGCYVLDNVAIKDGTLHDVNGEDFYDLGQLAVKSLNRSVSLTINRDPDGYTTEWVNLLWKAFGPKGMVALTFWFGSLFAEQIRAAQSSYPFLEVVGKAGAGKSTLIEFLWKLFGRAGYEGFDPSKSSLAARARNFSQVSGLPVVLIESDRERMDGDKSHVKSFDWDELKTAYNGRSTRARGMNTGGNETYEPPFRGAIVISQNNPVNASEAILSRIVHLYFDLTTQTPESGEAADALKFMPAEKVSGFILAATKREKKIMETVAERTAVYLKELRMRPEIKMPRLVETHAQMLALTDALGLVIKLTPEQQKAMREQIITMAGERQQVINDDHTLVQEFWEAFDYLDSNDMHRLNHSRDPQLIAVNLNHFVQIAAERRQQIPVIGDLKKVLRTSRRRKFLDVRVVNSQIRARDNALGSTAMKCWVFQNDKPTN
ncbi:toprim domain-containing protein [Collimonas pratensis]|uniref:Toprim domain protein n=1 Tax=Collimonas pratensis TaxID=279113 RepID=A0ABM5Z3T4_9BURK|nr:toprim domain-containing protein [Collimonas pratensis]AMP13456.1 toprim domain protein [Collimonas pratensis]